MTESDTSAQREEAKTAWIDYYKDRHLKTKRIVCVQDLNRYQLYQRVLIKALLKEIDKRLPAQGTVSVWSAGAGIDTISLYIKNVRRDSIRLLIQDISPDCIAVNREMFSECGLEADFAVGDVFSSKHREAFDIVFNTGLLEHFDEPDQKRLLGIFSTSLRKGGTYLTLTPFLGARLCALCRPIIERKGGWKVGPEKPVTGMARIGAESYGLALVEEHQVAARDQIGFLVEAFPGLRRILIPIVTGVNKLPESFEPLFIRVFGGYCIFDKFSKV